MVNVKARITPICTGNTKTKPGKVSFPRDHPRIHGEHFLGISRLTMRSGSPPHTRGTHQNFMEAAENLGITPAYTGNTDFFNYLECNPWDHPRIHGEHRFKSYITFTDLGSPPHTRGTRININGIQKFMRITPAYTGNTLYQNSIYSTL